jgi:hypothetical protein
MGAADSGTVTEPPPRRMWRVRGLARSARKLHRGMLTPVIWGFGGGRGTSGTNSPCGSGRCDGGSRRARARELPRAVRLRGGDAVRGTTKAGNTTPRRSSASRTAIGSPTPRGYTSWRPITSHTTERTSSCASSRHALEGPSELHPRGAQLVGSRGASKSAMNAEAPPFCKLRLI